MAQSAGRGDNEGAQAGFVGGICGAEGVAATANPELPEIGIAAIITVFQQVIITVQNFGSVGIYAAFASSLFLSFNVIFDRLMVGDCYRNRPMQAWLVSSIAGSVYGLIATGLTWAGYAAFTQTLFSDLARVAVDLAFPYGLVMCLAGAVTVQVLCHYFRLFVPERGREANETAVALWLSASPLFVFVAIFAFNQLGLQIKGFSGLQSANLDPLFGLMVAVAVGAFVMFESHDAADTRRGRMAYGEVAKMLGCIVGYSLLIASVMNQPGFGLTQTLALQPYFWLGFLAGARVWFRADCRADFKANWKRLRKFLRVIAIVEILGMSVYFTEFFALSDTDPTLVNLIIGGHVTIVFFLGIALGLVRRKMQANGQARVWVFGLRLVAHKLPELDFTAGRFARLLFAQAALVAAMLLA